MKLNQRQMAESLGIQPRTFANWRVPAAGQEGRHKLYSVADVLANRLARQARQAREQIDRLEARVAELETDEDGKTHAEILAEQHRERTRLLREQADAQALKNEIQRHEVAPFGFLTFLLGRLANQIAGVLDGLPAEAMRAGKLTAQQVDKLRGLTATVGDDLAALGDPDWISEQYAAYLETLK